MTFVEAGRARLRKSRSPITTASPPKVRSGVSEGQHVLLPTDTVIDCVAVKPRWATTTGSHPSLRNSAVSPVDGEGAVIVDGTDLPAIGTP
jgi:hypothetical protein